MRTSWSDLNSYGKWLKPQAEAWMLSDRRVFRRAIMHIRRSCPGAPASALCSLVAERSPHVPGFGTPFAAEETRSSVRVPRLEASRKENPMGEPICQPELTPEERHLIGLLRHGQPSVAG
jgi:hypothetical protein